MRTCVYTYNDIYTTTPTFAISHKLKTLQRSCTVECDCCCDCQYIHTYAFQECLQCTLLACVSANSTTLLWFVYSSRYAREQQVVLWHELNDHRAVAHADRCVKAASSRTLNLSACIQHISVSLLSEHRRQIQGIKACRR